ncbi:Glucuronosyltransferase [Aphelenchoides bicaudatus]|nr:Glucuronosyltransferase [Aphelenchoides bicaudatus]
MQSAKRGVVFMSFGTVTKSVAMPDETKKAFLDAFATFPDITFLWKYEKDDGVADGYKNVVTGQWWPQKDLLVHNKTLLFITHGGANSISEAATAGVPVIALPLFGDQSRNALMAEFRGFGVMLENLDLTKEKIVDALKKVIDNESYNRNAKELSAIIKAKPYNSDEIFIKYSEFAAKFDLHERLDLYGRKLSTIQFYNLDVFAFIIGAIVLVVLIAALLLRCCVRCACRRCGKSKSKKD